jgi:hypothetical protein
MGEGGMNPPPEEHVKRIQGREEGIRKPYTRDGRSGEIDRKLD